MSGLATKLDEEETMATKHLTGTYPSGYDLLPKYSGLVVESAALVEGAGV